MNARVEEMPPSVTLVVGAETFMADRAVAAVVGAVRSADADSDVTEVTGADMSVGSLAEQLSPSLFAVHRVLVVRDVQNVSDEVGDALVGLASEQSADSFVVLVHPGSARAKKLLGALLKAGAREVKAERLARADDQVDFVRTEIRQAGGRIDEPAARKLVDSLGGDLRGLAAASAQLAADAPAGTVTGEVVATYFEGHSEVKGWVVADRAIEGRTAQAVEQLRWALETGTDPVLIVGALATSLRSLARLSGVPRGTRDADIASDLGVPPWKVRVLRSQLRGWSTGGLASAIRAVAAADLEVKGAGTDPTLALTKALVTIGSVRSS